MTVIRISERSQQDDGPFAVQVAFDEDSEYDVRVSDPADPGGEELLAWYFGQHLRFPFLDADKERLAVLELARYGQDLFRQVLGGEASHDYRTLRERAFDRCRLEITGSAAFHQLHWEALRDPKIDAPLAVRLPVTRRVGHLESKFRLPPERSTLNILVVTARPFGKGDVGYRTISRPLLDALRQSRLPEAPLRVILVGFTLERREDGPLLQLACLPPWSGSRQAASARSERGQSPRRASFGSQRGPTMTRCTPGTC